MELLKNTIFIIPFLTGISYLIGGWFLINKPPSNVNQLYGYRTKASKQSKKHWDFAQRFGGKEMAKCGLYLVIFSLLGFAFPDGNLYMNILAFTLSIGICFLAMYKTEKALKALN